MASRTHLWETVLAGKWRDLGDGALQDALEVAFSSGADGYRFKARGYTYDIDFGRMKQVNLTTKRERDLRRVPDPRVSSTVVPTIAVSVAPKASRAESLLLHGVAPPSTAPAVPKTTAPPKTGKFTRDSGTAAATARGKSAGAAPAATVWGKIAAAAPAATAPAPMAPSKALHGAVSAPPLAPTPTPVAKKPLSHQGKVKTFLKEKGYGFIILDDDQEVFFHISCVSDLLDGSIRANDTVEVAVAKAGKPRALQVRVKRRGSIFKQMCTNRCCQDKGDRHFEDRCPLRVRMAGKRGGC